MQKIGNIPNTRADNNGEFTDGNVAGGVPPTILPAEWFNTIQRELISILSAAGITPDSNKFDQVSKAVSKLITDGGFLKTVNNLSEIKTAGAAAVTATLENLGLSDVAHIPFVQTMGARMVSFLTAGTFTFTVPDGVTRIRARVVGGGGGAGGSGAGRTGGGGGGGGYAESWITVTPGQVLTIIVGSAGNGGGVSGAGSNGGASSVSGFLSASGGLGGAGGGVGTGGGGIGGVGTGGQFNTTGSDGVDGTNHSDTSGAAGAAGSGGGSVLGGMTRSGTGSLNATGIGSGGSCSYLYIAATGGNGHDGGVILEY
ncbi:glycine-rich domain-containing protein [Yersinia intermedia]|uniref:glycine-rich domain-containing protein n=1 Tax=Yersinia intermedia TaxID=631 RepID=UPI0005E659F3|nr:hypothetical protein [Yersinia intermedia]CNI72942.1 bacteriophage tail fiber protein [Yersinia intermedia]